MTQAKRLDRFYDRLDAAERFRLAIKARGRGDEREFRRLVDSCPQHVYRCTDLAFSDRCDASEAIADAAMTALLPIKAKLELVAAFQRLFSVAMHQAADRVALAYIAGRRESKEPLDDEELEAGIERAQAEPHELHDRLDQALSEIESALQGEAAAVLEAFSTGCREDMGLEPEEVLSAHWGPIADLAFADVAPDREVVRELGERISRMWLTAARGAPESTTANTSSRASL